MGKDTLSGYLGSALASSLGSLLGGSQQGQQQDQRQQRVMEKAIARRQGGGQGGSAGYPKMGYQFMPTPNAWTPTPYAQQTPYAASQIGSARVGADAARDVAGINAASQNWGNTLDFLGQVQQSPWSLANTAQATLPAAQASMYGSYAGSLADILGSYYPAATEMSTAHYQPWSQVYQAGLGANLQRDLAQMQNEAQYARQQSLFGAVNPLIQALSVQPQLPSLTTNYGAGLTGLI